MWQRLIQLVSSGRIGDLCRRIVRLSAYGTQGYPARIRRRLKIMNVTAYVIVVFTLIYAVQQMFLDFETWKPVIFINLAMATVAATIPFLHRYGELTGPVVILLSELTGIFALTYYIGRDSGLHLQYFAGPAAFFVILGLERLKLIAAFVLISFALYLACWSWFLQSTTGLTVDQVDLDAHYVTAVITTFSVISIVVYYAFRLVEQAQAETDALLHNILPDSIVDRLKEEPEATIANEFAEASVLFADIKGFVSLAKQLGPAGTVELLNTIVRAFDELADRWGVEKIKTIGDAYMAAAGLPVPAPDHAERIAGMSLAMLDTALRIADEKDVELALRVGIASGPVLAGVIGAKRLIYDVWGDTVNLASRLEGQSQAQRILVSELTHKRLEGRYVLEPRGAVDIKGYGAVQAWFLIAPLGESAADSANAGFRSQAQAVALAGK
ncbi:MAG TPA: adenylate/guanylate cyclase domain-containing protein [Aestuariivirgaceae bacterium]|nr:adenylate/guanylate cyclase domain-containing protein [Aestuariivirgaceae bacterium]